MCVATWLQNKSWKLKHTVARLHGHLELNNIFVRQDNKGRKPRRLALVAQQTAFGSAQVASHMCSLLCGRCQEPDHELYCEAAVFVPLVLYIKCWGCIMQEEEAQTTTPLPVSAHSHFHCLQFLHHESEPVSPYMGDVYQQC